MQLPWIARTRAQIMRKVGPRLLNAPGLRKRLIGWRAEPVDGNTCDADLAALLGLGDKIGATSLESQNAAAARAEMAESSMMVEEDACSDVRVQDRILLHDNLRIPARFYVPTNLPQNSPGIVYFHGGGFAIGDLDTHDRYCQRLAKDSDTRVMAIDYRLAPENPFPAAIEDAVAAFRCIAGRAKEFDMNPRQIAVMGDSAGGNLSAVLAQKTKEDALKPALQVLVYPATDGSRSMKSHELFGKNWVLTSEKMEWFYHVYVGDDLAARRQPDVSPLFAESLRGLPPALVYTAGFDPLRDEGIAYAERLEKEGIPARHHCFKSLIHGFVSMGGICPAARDAALHIARDVSIAVRDGLSALA